MPETPRTVEEQQKQMESGRWPGVSALAEKWGVAFDTVKAIPREKLPYLTFGGSRIRRYDPDDVAAYEENEKRGVAA